MLGRRKNTDTDMQMSDRRMGERVVDGQMDESRPRLSFTVL